MKEVEEIHALQLRRKIGDLDRYPSGLGDGRGPSLTGRRRTPLLPAEGNRYWTRCGGGRGRRALRAGEVEVDWDGGFAWVIVEHGEGEMRADRFKRDRRKRFLKVRLGVNRDVISSGECLLTVRYALCLPPTCSSRILRHYAVTKPLAESVNKVHGVDCLDRCFNQPIYTESYLHFAPVRAFT